MLEWIIRGLGQGRITTGYPRRAEAPPRGFHGSVKIVESADPPAAIAEVCPTGAIATTRSRSLTLDQGRCILCGECVRAAPGHFAFDECYETAARTRAALVAGGRPSTDTSSMRRSLGEQARMLRRSIHVRHIDCGSDGAEEWEIQSLWNPYYDIQRLGFFLTAAPRHADLLLVTGGVTEPMRAPLERTWDVMPEPKALLAVGTDACSGGLAAEGGLVAGGVDRVLEVDVYVPGSPPSPIAIMHGLLLATGVLLPAGGRTA